MKTSLIDNVEMGFFECSTRISYAEWLETFPQVIRDEVIRQATIRLVDELFDSGKIWENLDIPLVGELVSKGLSKRILEILVKDKSDEKKNDEP